MAADAQRLAAFEAELARLSEEVSKLADIRAGLRSLASEGAVAHHLIELGRQLEREEMARSRRRSRRAARRPQHLQLLERGQR